MSIADDFGGGGPYQSSETQVIKALNRIAKALESQAEAIELLARATAGEFDAGDEERLPRSLGER